ncbi:MAG: PEP-CTERM sorting domain-containing protein [Nitrosomonadaceae bacterium]
MKLFKYLSILAVLLLASTSVQATLVINASTAVPLPTAFWLFGTALIGFVGVSRRRSV